MVSPQQFCVKWNSYSSNLQTVFPRLLTSEHFVDITLACEGQMIKCHKVVLSACSTYFEELLVSNPCQHPIIFMKDMKHWEIQALVDFMYKGEVNVSQDELNSLLVAAEALQIRGLCSSEGLNGSADHQSTSAEVRRLPNGTVVSGRGDARKSPSPPMKRARLEEQTEKVYTTKSATDRGAKRRSSKSDGLSAKEGEQRGENEEDMTVAMLQKKLIKEEDLDDDADRSFTGDGDAPDDYEQQEDSDGASQSDALARAGPSGVAQGLYSATGSGDKAGTGRKVKTAKRKAKPAGRGVMRTRANVNRTKSLDTSEDSRTSRGKASTDDDPSNITDDLTVDPSNVTDNGIVCVDLTDAEKETSFVDDTKSEFELTNESIVSKPNETSPLFKHDKSRPTDDSSYYSALISKADLEENRDSLSDKLTKISQMEKKLYGKKKMTLEKAAAMFLGAELTPGEEALIVSFINGSRVNPFEQRSSVVTFKLHECGARNLSDGTVKTVMKAETLFQIDYETGDTDTVVRIRRAD